MGGQGHKKIVFQVFHTGSITQVDRLSDFIASMNYCSPTVVAQSHYAFLDQCLEK